jgi:N-acetylmuramoyl-L-alanine amidase
MTRNDDTFVPLESSNRYSKSAGADLFISIHANSSKSDRRAVSKPIFKLHDSKDALETASREAASDRSIHDLQDLVKDRPPRE